jgi:hypothetical protein
MSNKRAEIRAYLKTMLAEKISDVESRVFDSLPTPIWEEDDCPCLNILTPREKPERKGQGNGFNRIYSRVMDLVIEVGVKNTDDPAAELDDICKKLENAINGDPTLGKNCTDIEYDGTDTVIVGEGNKPFGVAEIRYLITYVN